MADPACVPPVKLVVAILWSDEERRRTAMKRLGEHFGPIDFEGPSHLFDATDFYDKEMGRPIWRQWIAHQLLVAPESLVDAKETTNRIEDELRQDGSRKVNLDVGYLDMHKVVLASMKPAGQKIHLARGVYADLSLRYARGGYQPLEWTFLDLRDGRYSADLLSIRGILKDGLRARGPA